MEKYKPTYCIQNDGNCDICSLVNYGRDCRNNPIERIKINGKDASIFYAVNHWREAGVCEACIDYRIRLNRTFQDGYGDFHKKHDADNCTCGVKQP